MQSTTSKIEDIHSKGWATFDLDLNASTKEMAQHEVLARLGKIIRIFDVNEDWRVLDVDTTRPLEASRGAGRGFLHMDFVNAETPPDYIGLLCAREDPLGGGQSRLSRIEGIERELPGAITSSLMERSFSDGKVENLTNVGRDINPFSVISPRETFQYRFTGRLSLAGENRFAAEVLNDILELKAETVMLRPGQLLIVNQHLAVHGRNALGIGQDSVPVRERRLLYQIFLRSYEQ